MTNKLGLYLHIPYCRSKCSYCDFYSLPDRKDYRRYADALILHMQDYSERLKYCIIDTVFIGGGTPTALPISDLVDIINRIGDNFKIERKAEITVECNPATVGLAELKKLRKAGVNRLSIGMQSACDRELAALSRIHNYKDVEECFKLARKAGFNNINLDIMYGIPEQTPKSLKLTLDTVCKLNPEHISFYALKIEDGTPFAKMKDRLHIPDDDIEADMYMAAIELLRKNGYEQYEISNFAKKGYECRHNLKYWNCDEYLGLGPGAHSFLGGQRFSFKRDIDCYMDAMENIETRYGIVDENYTVKPEERIGEYVMLRLRTTSGVDKADFYDLFSVEFDDRYGKTISPYINGGFMTSNEDRCAFTPKGMFVSNYILSSMLDFDGDIAESMSGDV